MIGSTNLCFGAQAALTGASKWRPTQVSEKIKETYFCWRTKESNFSF
jgi:hypothetical protein